MLYLGHAVLANQLVVMFVIVCKGHAAVSAHEAVRVPRVPRSIYHRSSVYRLCGELWFLRQKDMYINWIVKTIVIVIDGWKSIFIAR